MEVNTDKLFSIEKNLQYIYGEGVKYNYITKKSYDFKGLLPIDEIDSGRMIKNNENEYSFYWSKDGYKYVFTNSNVFTIPTGTEKTFWVINNGSLRKIDRNEIESIEIQKTNWITASILVVILGIFLILITAIVEHGIGTGSRHYSY